MDKSKLLILVTGTTLEPHNKNWKECESTWIPILRNMGYTVKIALGIPSIQHEWIVTDDIVYFKAEDSKRGLVDKSIRLPAKWILTCTDYEYYFRIDSDSFVHPERFEAMLNENFNEVADIDYMGSCHPVLMWDVTIPSKFTICKEGHIASGAAYLVSRKAMKIALDNIRLVEDFDAEIDDWVLGRAMWESGIELLHDGRIYFESKYHRLVYDPDEVGVQNIGDTTSFLAIQHYMNDHMEEAMVSLGYRK